MAWLLVAVLMLALQAGDATAASRLCRNLESRLAGLSGGGSAQAARYDRAITVQQSELQAARAQSRQAGCGFAVFPGRVAQCGRLAATIERMESNLVDLQQKRSRMSGSDNRRERARLMAAIDVNGCRERPPQETASATRQGASIIQVAPGARALPLGSQYRTMCVRSCDGYYFPIEQASSPQYFQRDQQKCESLCPGTKVELYYHSPDQEAGEMMSVASGLAYAQQPFAFRYRDANYRRPESCGCNAPKEFSIIAGDRKAKAQSVAVEIALPQPEARPDPALDPESYANQQGGLDRAAIDRLLPKPANPRPSPAESDGERSVRVVGPTFLPDPEAAIDLRVPARPAGP